MKYICIIIRTIIAIAVFLILALTIFPILWFFGAKYTIWEDTFVAFGDNIFHDTDYSKLE